MSDSLRERLYNGIWLLGYWVVRMAKRLGIAGPFQEFHVKVARRLIPFPSRETEVTLSGGAKIVIPPGFPMARSYATGVYEREVTALVQDTLNQGMSMVDVGAFCGYYTVLASRLVGNSGRVYAFEPAPDAYQYLKRNIASNDCRNVTASDEAVSDEVGTAAFAPIEKARGFLSSHTLDHSSLMVQTVTLDSFFSDAEWPQVDLIKIDVEGGEKAVLGGMRELSRRNPHLRLIMEFSLFNMGRSGVSCEDLTAVLQELGFRSGFIIEQGMKPFSVVDAFPRSRAFYDLLLTKE